MLMPMASSSPMKSQISNNVFCTYTGDEDEADTTIFFISGNPGLISYYHPFLSLLAKNLGEEGRNIGLEDLKSTSQSTSTDTTTSCRIYGCSLGGFEVTELNQDSSKRPSSPPNAQDCQSAEGSRKLYDLEEQICFVQEKLNTLMQSIQSRKKQKVILIGHSVGTYMAMEILRRHREATSTAESGESNTQTPDFDIIGAIMLFPTVIDISASPSGQKLTTLLSIIPQLALVVSLFARFLTFILPDSILKSVIRTVMKKPPPHALETTFAFLKSPGGVRQALHMAADEMRSITTDKWTDDVWGVASTGDPVAKLYFYFGRNDHWVAEKTRDEIIALKGSKDGLGPKMFVCEDGLPHAFCLNHNEIVARKVTRMIREII